MYVRKLKHFQPHSLLCHLWCILYLQFIRLYVIVIYVNWQKLTKQLRQTFFFFLHHIHFFHIANQLFQYSSTSRTIASSQYHPRETRPLLGQPNLYKNYIIGFAYVEFVSYNRKKKSMFLLNRFLAFSYFFFFLTSTSYIIWNWVKAFAYSISAFSYFFFFFPSTSYIIWNRAKAFA